MFKLPEWKYLKYNLQQKIEEIFGRGRHGYREGGFLNRSIHLREVIASNPIIFIPLISVCLLVALIFIRSAFFPDGEQKIESSGKVWFYDLNTDQLFVADKTSVPPIEAPSGPLASGEPAGVAANVIVYGEQIENQDKHVAYLEKMTPQAKLDMEIAIENDDLSSINWSKGRLICTPKDKKWVIKNSPEGIEIIRQAAKPNALGQSPRFVFPE